MTGIGEVPKRFKHATVRQWHTKTGNDEVRDAVQNYLDNIEPMHDTGTGLLLMGPAGVGKSFLACSVLNEVMPKYTGRFYPAYTYMRMLLRNMELYEKWKAQYDEDTVYAWEVIGKELRGLRNKVDFLVLDDVGMEHHTATRWAEDELQITLRWRFDLSLPTIITTNTTNLDDWRAYGESMPSFLREACVSIPVNSGDLR